jgi:HEAT repeat protein
MVRATSLGRLRRGALNAASLAGKTTLATNSRPCRGPFTIRMHGQIGDSAAIPALVEAAGNDDYFRAKVAIAVAMVKLDHPEGLKMVAAFISDDVSGNRNYAAAMITSIDAAKLQNPEIVNPLIAAINHPENNAQNGPARGLGHIASDEAVDALLGRLSDRENLRTYLQALGDSKRPKALEALANYLEDKDPAIRVTAVTEIAKFDVDENSWNRSRP